MNNENYLNHYVEILTTTMTDAVVRNISMQANLRMKEETISDLTKEIERLSVLCANQSKNIENLTEQNTQSKTTYQTMDSDFNRMKTEFENMKRQVSNAEVFRNELTKERDAHRQTRVNLENTIGDLKNKIEILQAPPKRKKPTKVEQPEQEIKQEPVPEDGTVKDGGSF